MIYLALRTDSENSELHLIKDSVELDSYIWLSSKNLARELPSKIKEIMYKNKVEKLDGYIGYLGPGSFTGLRIGLTTINTIAYAENCKVVGSSGVGWIEKGVAKLNEGKDEKLLLPSYGAAPHITTQKK